MRPVARRLSYALLGALVIGLAFWWWGENMERSWQASTQTSEAARENPMLAATRLLNAHRVTVESVEALGETTQQPLPDGIVMLAGSAGTLTKEQALQLRAWVQRGNTLIAKPTWRAWKNPPLPPAKAEDAAAKTGKEARNDEQEQGDETDGDGDPVGADAGADDARVAKSFDTGCCDPLGEYLGVGLARRRVLPEPDAPADGAPKKPGSGNQIGKQFRSPRLELAYLTMPGADYALRLGGKASLRSTGKVREPWLADKAQNAVRVYREGKGLIVMVSDNLFDNDNLGRHDHAELLLALLGQHTDGGGAKHMRIVKRLDVSTWYQILGRAFPYAIVATVCGLLLLLWSALRRFGPLLPDAQLHRRAVMEHVDASGRWLWKVAGGRDILLDAVRNSVNQTLQRRAADIHRLPPHEQVERLAQLSDIPAADLGAALLPTAASAPLAFTRQIQTLQKIIKHYER